MKSTMFSTLQCILLICLMLYGVNDANAVIVDFEELTLSPESYWSGPDPNGTDEIGPFGGTIRVGSYQSNNLEFVNRYNLTYSSWSGFAYSNTTNTTTPGYTNQYSAYTGSGYNPGDDNYGVACGYDEYLNPSDPSHLQQLPYIELPPGADIESAYITNTTYAALSMLNGDQFAKKFGGTSGNEPDWFKLNVYGTDALGDPLANTVEFFLADYRFSDNLQDYVVDEWTLVDLSPLADARCLYFNLTSTDNGMFGMNTPGYFAIDNINLAAIPGDANLDNVVDNTDAAMLAANWLTPTDASWSQGDFDGNGAVDSADATILAANWQSPASTASVPEPGSLAIVLFGSLCTVAFMRRKKAIRLID